MGRTKAADGYINARYRLCREGLEEQRHLPRKLKSKITINDKKLDLDLKLSELSKEAFRMDQGKPNDIKFSAWEEGMAGLWTKAPDVNIASFSIGFLRTTNLLLPGKRVINFDSNICLRAPRDFVLVGQVAPFGVS